MTGAPVSAADILAKMGQPDIVEPDAPIAHEPIDAAPDENLEECPKKDDAIGEDDDSIEAYMNQLLSRVRGDVDTDKTADVTKPEKESASKQDYEEFDDPVQQTDSSVLSELVARTEAPEQVEGLSAMRDLANDTTRTAIATYDMKSGGKSAFAKLVAAGLGVSAAVLSTLYLEDNPMVRLFGIGVGLSSAAVWTWQAVVLKQRSASVVQEPNSSSEDDSEDDSETTPSDEG
jgi:hypothetical protein